MHAMGTRTRTDPYIWISRYNKPESLHDGSIRLDCTPESMLTLVHECAGHVLGLSALYIAYIGANAVVSA